MKRKVWDLTVLDNPNRAVAGENDVFYTTDTEAFLIFRLTDDGMNPTTASLTLVNTTDKSVINETVSVINNEIEWEVNEEAILHSGNWQGQLVYMQEKDGKPERYTAPVIQFDIKSHLLTGRKPGLVVIDDWDSFMVAAREFMDQLEDEVDGVFIDIDELEQQYRDSEQEREDAENVRKANESARQTKETQRELAESERNDLHDLVQQKLENGEFVGEKGDKGLTGSIDNLDITHIEDALGFIPISADDIPEGITLGEGPIEEGWLFKPVTIADERNE